MSRLLKLPIKVSAGLGLSLLNRAVKETFARRCSPEELETIRTWFEQNGGLDCLYCGAVEAARWDHLHPVTRGGDTVPGNLVPACPRCDDSKQDRTIAEWAASSSPHRPSPERAAEIEIWVSNYQRRFAYSPVPFDQKLSDHQRTAYGLFRQEIEALRAHLVSAGLIRPPKSGC